MMKVLAQSRILKVSVFALIVLVIAAFAIPYTEFYREWVFEGKAKVREGPVKAEVINSSPIQPATVALALPSGFSPQTRLGFHVDNEWEPAIAADRFGHVYMIYPQYGGVPGCPTCYSPTMIFQMSSDHGQTWTSPSVIYPEG